jgi:hypothetical protein
MMPVACRGCGAQAARVGLGLRPRGGRDDHRGETPERRQHRPVALVGLALVKRLRLARGQRLHHRVLRLVGLDQALALAPRAPGPAGHLRQELVGPLGGARIAVRQPEIGIDHADQRHQREIVPLGHQLRADDDIGLAFCNRLELDPQAAAYRRPCPTTAR